MQKKYVDAERWYREAVTRFGNTHFAPEAMYWLAVAHYKAMNGVTVTAIEVISRGQTT